MGRPRKIDRILEVRSDKAIEAHSLEVAFYDAWGDLEQIFDFSKLEIPDDIAQAFALAFRERYSASATKTRNSVFSNLILFGRWLALDGQIGGLKQLDTAAFRRFIKWALAIKRADGKPRSNGAKRQLVSAPKQLILWLQRQHPDQLPNRIDIPYGIHDRREPSPKPVLSEDDLKTVLRACYEEIKAAWARFEIGQRIVNGESVEGIDPDLTCVIKGLHAARDGDRPTNEELYAAGVPKVFPYRYGGIRRCAEYLALTVDTLAPFFIALSIQTGANRDALRVITRDCLSPHPLDEHLMVVEWDKPRAGMKVRHQQRRSFDRRRAYAAPNLIEMLLSMTDAYARQASPRDRNRLFVMRVEGKKGAYTITEGTLYTSLRRFIARANQRISFWNDAYPSNPRRYLPPFNVTMLRASIATEHYVAAAGNIQHAQKILNHQNVATTERYIRGASAHALQTETIARLQRQLVSWVSGVMPDHQSNAQKQIGPATLFSHRCLNPFDPPEGGGSKGGVCRNIQGCLTCPGLVVPIDAEHLARLLLAKAELEATRDRLTAQRWHAIYAPTYAAIVEDLLPDFPKHLFASARKQMADLTPLAELE